MTERASKAPGAAPDFTVGEWLVQPSLNRLARGDESMRLRPQLMNLLVCLADRPAQTVTREEILSIVWPGQFIADTGLARCIAELRQALGDSAGQDSKYIETIPKRGYRLIAPVGPAPAVVQAAAAAATATVAVSAAGPAPAPAGAVVNAAAVADQPGPGAAATSRRKTRAVFVAAASVIVLAAAVAAWFALGRGTGVAHDTLVIAFDNTTGDALFDDALRLALSRQLEQSPALRVVSDQRVREELGFMNRPSDTHITRSVASDLCQRVGAKAVVAGTLAPVGRHYAVGLEGVECQSGTVIAREQVEVTGKEQVLAALGQAASSIRGRLGESVASIRQFDVPIARATTPSLEALKAFSQGDVERGRGYDEAAVRFYRRAVELDPSFALAHLRLGLQLGNLSHVGEGVQELKLAYAARDRASEGERRYITAVYYMNVVRDLVKAAEALESWRDGYPKNPAARYTLASVYGRIGRFEEGLVQVQEALRLEPNDAVASLIRAELLIRLGRVAEAKTLCETDIAQGRNGVHTHMELAKIGFEFGDPAAVRRELQWAATTPDATPAFLELEAGMLGCSGKIREASRLLDRRLVVAAQRGDEETAAATQVDDATFRAFAGQTIEPAPLVNAAIVRAPAPTVVIRGALALALTGDADAAEQALHRYERMPDVIATSDAETRPAVIALIAIHRGFAESALDTLAAVRPYERGWWFNHVATYVRGLALMKAKRYGEAASEFERIVRQPGGRAENPVFTMAWLQLGRAKAAGGDAKAARAPYEQFLRHWKDADADLPVLAQAREELAKLR